MSEYGFALDKIELDDGKIIAEGKEYDADSLSVNDFIDLFFEVIDSTQYSKSKLKKHFKLVRQPELPICIVLNETLPTNKITELPVVLIPQNVCDNLSYFTDYKFGKYTKGGMTGKKMDLTTNDGYYAFSAQQRANTVSFKSLRLFKLLKLKGMMIKRFSRYAVCYDLYENDVNYRIEINKLYHNLMK